MSGAVQLHGAVPVFAQVEFVAAEIVAPVFAVKTRLKWVEKFDGAAAHKLAVAPSVALWLKRIAVVVRAALRLRVHCDIYFAAQSGSNFQ